jgi:hypothetical protein
MLEKVILSKSITMVMCRMALGMFVPATAVAVEPPAAASPGRIQMVQYYPGTAFGVPPGMTSQQLLALGAQQRAMAAAVAGHAARRMDSTLNQAHDFDMQVIRGCGFYYGRYYCP